MLNYLLSGAVAVAGFAGLIVGFSMWPTSNDGVLVMLVSVALLAMSAIIDLLVRIEKAMKGQAQK